jgi:hypothetical protein
LYLSFLTKIEICQLIDNATRAWIYVFGGIDAERNVLSSFEYLNITSKESFSHFHIRSCLNVSTFFLVSVIRPDPETKGREAQQVGLWRNGTTFLSGARYGLNAAGLTNAYVLSIPPGRVRIYIAGGRTNFAGGVTEVRNIPFQTTTTTTTNSKLETIIFLY